MLRLRTKRESFPTLMAAEVLELRSLLSAGAAAVHQATHAAGQATAHPASHPVLTPFPVSLSATNTQGTLDEFTGSLTMTPVTLKVGTHVTLNVTGVDTTTVPLTYTVVIKGKISFLSPGADTTNIQLIPSGTLTVKDGSGHTLTTAKAGKAHPLTLNVVNLTGAFIECDLQLTAKAKPPVLISFQAELG